MLSILIPSYNYNVFPLVHEVYEQCVKEHIKFEIVVLDDGSQLFHNENSKINTLQNCNYKILENNIGRTAIRSLLAKTAVFNHLLFLDADVLPATKNFIKNYVDILQNSKETNAIFGGYLYLLDFYLKSNSLRYYYGKKREENTAENRNKSPFSYIFSGNFLIKKNVFLSLEIPCVNVYGMDVYFSYLLKKSNIKVIHINNEIIHKGIESNDVYFKKALTAVKYRKDNWLEIAEITEINTLLKVYKKFNFFPLNNVFKFSFKILKKPLHKLCFMSKPYLWAFDLYRLLYLFKLN